MDARSRVRSLGIADGAPIVGTVGRLEPAKGHITLLRAVPHVAKKWPTARFVLVGEGYLRPDLEAEARRLGIEDRVTFTGFRDDMLELLQGFDVFALPSLWEGLGIVLLEAMAYEKPVVASSVGGVLDVVVDRETGLLVPPASPPHLAEAISGLLSDRQRAREMGLAGYQRLLHEFRDETAIHRMYQLYHSMMRGRAALDRRQ